MSLEAMRFRIGVFVLAALLLLGVLVTLFGSFPTFFKPQNQYTVVFEDAPGVDSGTPVRRSGQRIGEVKSLTLDDETGEVRVVVVIDKKYTIRHNEVPTLVHGLFGTDTSIDLVPRRPDKEKEPGDRSPVAPGEEMRGVRQANVSQLLGQAAEVVAPTQETLNSIRKLTDRVDEAIRKLGGRADELAPVTKSTLEQYNQLGKESQEAVRELRETNKKIQGLADEVQKLVPEVGKTNTAVQDLAKATRETIPELSKTNAEVQVTARNWGKLGERLDVLVQGNQDKIVKVIDNLNESLSRAASLLSEENQRNLSATLKNVRNSSERLDGLAKNTDDMVKESRQTVKRFNESLTKADEVVTNLQQATKPLADRGGSFLKNLDEIADKLNRFLGEYRDLSKTLTQGDGTLKRVLTDPSLYNHLDDAALMLTRILPRVDRALKDLEVFADKLARHPEAIGLGGVVRPGSGLKDSSSGGGLLWPKGPGH